MTEPVTCGCGGKPEYSMTTRIFGIDKDIKHYVTCQKCLIIASGETKEEAIKNWNTAMSGNRIRLHELRFVDGEEPLTRPMLDTKKGLNRWRCYSCGAFISRVWNYCQHCGAKIDWKNSIGE